LRFDAEAVSNAANRRMLGLRRARDVAGKMDVVDIACA
jgi:hypothetical protein